MVTLSHRPPVSAPVSDFTWSLARIPESCNVAPWAPSWAPVSQSAAFPAAPQTQQFRHTSPTLSPHCLLVPHVTVRSPHVSYHLLSRTSSPSLLHILSLALTTQPHAAQTTRSQTTRAGFELWHHLDCLVQLRHRLAHCMNRYRVLLLSPTTQQLSTRTHRKTIQKKTAKHV